MVLGVYSRVSTEEQRINGLSLNDQILRGVECAKKNGFESHEVFQDGGLSGSLPVAKRPQLSALVDKILQGKIHAVFVTDLDRLSRDHMQNQYLKSMFKENGIRVFDVQGEINLNDVNHELLADLRSLLSSFEIKKTSARIKRVLERNVMQGKVGGGVMLPYGYTKDKEKMMIVDDVEAIIVQMIFKFYLQGMGAQKIAIVLHRMKIPTRRNKTAKGGFTINKKNKRVDHDKVVWRDAVVLSILTNPLYMGKRRYKGAIYDAPAIIDAEVFEAAQEMRIRNRTVHDGKASFFYMLRGMLVCGKCGQNLYGKRRNDLTDNQYICCSQRYPGEYCGTRGVNIDFLNDLVWKSLINMDKEILDFYKWYEAENMTIKYMTKLTEQSKQKDLVEKRIENLLELGGDGRIKQKMFTEQLDKLDKELERIEKGIEQSKKQLKTLGEKKDTIEAIKAHIKDFKKENLTDQEKAHYLNIFIEKVTINWDEALVQHKIDVAYKIDRLTQYKVAASHKIEYVKKGWCYQRKNILKSQIQIKRTFIGSVSGMVAGVPMLEAI
jgi:site-specific DNA recombinase